MNPEALAQQIELAILSSIDNYSAAVESLQGTIYNRLLSVLKNLSLDSEGYILQNAANRSILLQAENALDELLPGESLTRAVSRSLEVISEIDQLNESYFSSISENFKANRVFLKSLQTQAIQSVENAILQDGLQFMVKGPLTDILNQNINSGGQFSGFLDQLRNFIRGTEENPSRLLSYSRTHLSDTLFNYSRAYQESITVDLKLDWYMYSGGVMDKTREFCSERAGNFYHRKEIEQWAELDWQGKRVGTTKSSIFIYAGGWNCRHSLIPVAETIVPKEDLARI